MYLIIYIIIIHYICIYSQFLFHLTDSILILWYIPWYSDLARKHPFKYDSEFCQHSPAFLEHFLNLPQWNSPRSKKPVALSIQEVLLLFSGKRYLEAKNQGTGCHCSSVLSRAREQTYTHTNTNTHLHLQFILGLPLSVFISPSTVRIYNNEETSSSIHFLFCPSPLHRSRLPLLPPHPTWAATPTSGHCHCWPLCGYPLHNSQSLHPFLGLPS